jgi:hypothetical protein
MPLSRTTIWLPTLKISSWIGRPGRSSSSGLNPKPAWFVEAVA